MNRRQRRAVSRDQARARRYDGMPVRDLLATTWWNGEPADARKVTLIVAVPGPFPLAWYRHIVGTRRAAVEVTYGGKVFYLDDLDGSGWWKVTEGRGSPRWAHRSLHPAPGTVEDRA